MGDEPRADPEHAPAGGVFGNLPASRPGTRSPRRDSSKGPPKATAAKPKRTDSQPRASATPPKRAADPPPRRPAPEPEAEPEPQPGGGLEDIAWAGVAAAAEAATIGVRLASRAIEALRGSAEKE